MVIHSPLWCLVQQWKKQFCHFGLEGRVLLAGQDNVIKYKNKSPSNNLGWSVKNSSLYLSSVSLHKTRKTEKRESDSAWKFSGFNECARERLRKKKNPLNYVLNIFKCKFLLFLCSLNCFVKRGCPTLDKFHFNQQVSLSIYDWEEYKELVNQSKMYIIK